MFLSKNLLQKHEQHCLEELVKESDGKCLGEDVGLKILYLQQDATDIQVSLQSLIKTPVSRGQRSDD